MIVIQKSEFLLHFLFPLLNYSEVKEVDNDEGNFDSVYEIN